MGGLLRCVECGEVHWNLRFSSRRDATQECRLCGSELKADAGRAGRRFERLVVSPGPADAAGLGPSATS